jgi:hypothetical protein
MLSLKASCFACLKCLICHTLRLYVPVYENQDLCDQCHGQPLKIYELQQSDNTALGSRAVTHGYTQHGA